MLTLKSNVGVEHDGRVLGVSVVNFFQFFTTFVAHWVFKQLNSLEPGNYIVLVPTFIVLFTFAVIITPIFLEIPSVSRGITWISLHAAIRDRFIHALRDDAV